MGHGIGTSLHQEPEIPNFVIANRGPLLRKGMTLAIEPMINEGTHKVDVCSNGWTAVTSDMKNSAHYENTVLITDGKPEILTLTEEDDFPLFRKTIFECLGLLSNLKKCLQD